MNECIFCEELSRNAPQVFYKSKSGLFAARWDHFPVVPGHVEVIPTRHVQYLKDFTPQELVEIFAVAQEVVKSIESAELSSVYQSLQGVNLLSEELIQKASQLSMQRLTAPDGYNLGINDGPAAGQSVLHAHLHIMPRWNGDVVNPRGGIRNIFAGDGYSLAG